MAVWGDYLYEEEMGRQKEEFVTVVAWVSEGTNYHCIFTSHCSSHFAYQSSEHLFHQYSFSSRSELRFLEELNFELTSLILIPVMSRRLCY